MSMTLLSIIQTDESFSESGSKIVSKFKVTFTGTFSTVYVYQNATTLGLIDYGDYVTGTSGEIYCSGTAATITENSPHVGTTAQPAVFTYTCEFQNIDAERKDLVPSARPQLINGGGTELTENRRYDASGSQNELVNSAGDYFTDTPLFFVPGCEFSITYNQSGNPATMAKTYSNSTNTSAIWGQDAYSGKIGKITFQNVYEIYQGILIEFWRVTIPIMFRNDGNPMGFWQPYDYGYRYLDSTTGKATAYVDPTSGVFSPVLLDGSGHLLGGDGSTTSADPVIYPSGSGSGPDGYQQLTGQDWSGLSVTNPFS